jgi:small subunit ribosomal protein S6
MVRAYEAIYILDPTLDDAKWDEDIETVKGWITSKGGEIKEVQKWGRRRLAYEIGKKKEGIYTLLHFEGDASVLSELNRRFRLNESVLRHLVVHHEEYTPPPIEDPADMIRGRGDRFDRGDRGDRYDRGDRGDRGDRYDRGDRGDRRERSDSPRPAPAHAARPVAEPAAAPAEGAPESGA